MKEIKEITLSEFIKSMYTIIDNNEETRKSLQKHIDMSELNEESDYMWFEDKSGKVKSYWSGLSNRAYRKLIIKDTST
jgi:hypothetical protein